MRISGEQAALSPQEGTSAPLQPPSQRGNRLPLEQRTSPHSPAEQAVKRTMDVVGSAALLAALGIPMIGIAAWIRLDSPGPAVFRQERAGRHKVNFIILKFRTMVDGADDDRDDLRSENDDLDVLFKLRSDPRMTRAGKWLRRFSLDELPQLVNVLRGEMSLIGPRPHPLDDVERYDERAWGRLAVKPGITGLWQVSGRSNLGWEESRELDLHYATNWTIGLDLKIIARTVGAVVRGDGAY